MCPRNQPVLDDPTVVHAGDRRAAQVDVLAGLGNAEQSAAMDTASAPAPSDELAVADPVIARGDRVQGLDNRALGTHRGLAIQLPACS
jgi:hypothetical protein